MAFYRWFRKKWRMIFCYQRCATRRYSFRKVRALCVILLSAILVNMMVFHFYPNDIIELLQDPHCPKMTIHTSNADQFIKDRVCQPHLTPKADCRYTSKKFAAVPSIHVCKDQTEPPYQLCSVLERFGNTGYLSLAVKCDFSVCNRTQAITIEQLDPSNGDLKQLVIPKNLSHSDVERLVRDKIVSACDGGFAFIFLNCVGWNQKKISQLLTLLPAQRVFAKKANSATSEQVNVNLILLDSISRAHFYRSLPKTVEFLRRKSANKHLGGHVFEFELFQAVHGHTHENEHALFSGTLYPSHFTEQQIENAPTNVEVLFGIFKRAGYQTLFMEDLCWKEFYGLIDSVKAGGWWGRFRKKVNASHIDSTGITEASCKLLENYGRSPFQDDGRHQLCFNGKHSHQYMLEYITRYIAAVRQRPQSKPLFSFTALNVAHDDEGVRVQSLDKDLRGVIEKLLQEQSTLTIIYADHGNTYTSYQNRLEGRLEMYHPMFLLILPEKLEKRFGRDVLLNLQTNQYRLLDLFDIRAGLVELAKNNGNLPMNPKGIFRPIPNNRTCDELQLTKASICLCKDWYQDIENSTSQLAVAEFAIGQLNNRIQELLLNSRNRSEQSGRSSVIFGACQRLLVEGIKNVQERLTPEGGVVTTMDVKVQSGNVVNQKERFSVRVERKQRSITTSQDMVLLAFDRTSAYGPHKTCADSRVDLQLCVCSKRTENSSKNASIHSEAGTQFNVIKLNTCLFLAYCSLQKSREDGKVVVYETGNVCPDRQFRVMFERVGIFPIVVVLKPNSMVFVESANLNVDSSQKEFVLRMRIAMKKNDMDQWGSEDFLNITISTKATKVFWSSSAGFALFSSRLLLVLFSLCALNTL